MYRCDPAQRAPDPSHDDPLAPAVYPTQPSGARSPQGDRGFAFRARETRAPLAVEGFGARGARCRRSGSPGRLLSVCGLRAPGSRKEHGGTRRNQPGRDPRTARGSGSFERVTAARPGSSAPSAARERPVQFTFKRPRVNAVTTSATATARSFRSETSMYANLRSGSVQSSGPQALPRPRARAFRLTTSVVLVAHCVLNQNAKLDACARYPGAIVEASEALFREGVGILQLPCPELLCLGLDRGTGPGTATSVEAEDTRIARRMPQRLRSAGGSRGRRGTC
jgi:hypothetical protein